MTFTIDKIEFNKAVKKQQQVINEIKDAISANDFIRLKSIDIHPLQDVVDFHNTKLVRDFEHLENHLLSLYTTIENL